MFHKETFHGDVLGRRPAQDLGGVVGEGVSPLPWILAVTCDGDGFADVTALVAGDQPLFVSSEACKKSTQQFPHGVR